MSTQGQLIFNFSESYIEMYIMAKTIYIWVCNSVLTFSLYLVTTCSIEIKRVVFIINKSPKSRVMLDLLQVGVIGSFLSLIDLP